MSPREASCPIEVLSRFAFSFLLYVAGETRPKKRKPVLTVGVRCLSVCESIYERTAARKKPSFPEWEKSLISKLLSVRFLRKYFPFFRFLLIERETVTSNTSPTRLRRFGSNPVQKRQPLNLAGITLVFEPGRRVHRGSIVPGHHVARLPAPLYGDIRSCDLGQQVANDQNTLVLDPFKAPLFQPRRVNGFAFAGNGTCRVVQPVGGRHAAHWMLKNNRHSVRRICRSLVFVEEWISRSIVADLLIVMGQRTDSFHLIKACLGFCIEAGVFLPLIGEQGFRPFGGYLTAMEDRSDRRVLPKGLIRIPDRTPGLRIVLYVGVGNERYALCERRLQISGLVFDITDAQDWRARHHSVPARGKARVLHHTKYDDKVINCAGDASAKSESRTATKPPLSVQRS